MFGGGGLKRLTIVCGVAAVLLSGCSLSEASISGTLPGYDATILQESASLDPCLEGSWTMLTHDLDIFMATLVPAPGLRVANGSVSLSMSEGMYEYGSDGFAIRIDLGPDSYLEGAAVFLTTGSYSTDDGKLNLVDNGTQKQITEWKGCKGGTYVPVPGGGVEFSMLPSGPMGYECGPEVLVLQSPGPTGNVPMVFTREL